ncbi:uncharacterized protein LOC107425637 isoform X1 [Ziziphus jujuba]|uniref:Uncharacterized protein LOC107425637 isoform X1 n=1 Tax=Ziziphus jujuba TaxID=326968 RepID=A0ABM4AEI9_ZIZJJ|nr:uncharacterized protein LOC107425637 isoform X1 [Ziziphus jujuba]
MVTQGHWQDQMERKSHYSFPHFAIEFVSNYYCIGRAFCEETLEKVYHFQQCFNAGGLLSIAETRPQFIADDTIWGTETNFFKNIKHFTDMVRKFLCPTDLMVLLSQPAQPNQPPCSSCYSQTNIYVNYNGVEDPSVHYTTCFYSAKQLDRAGVSFVPCKNQYLTNIVVKKFKYNFFPWKSLELVVLEFKIEDNTECLMRNVMALEQCVYPFQSYICDHISLLDHLINTAEDVELLVEKRIVDNLLGSNDAVTDLVNKLCDQIVESGLCYGTICKQLNKHHDNFWNVTKKSLSGFTSRIFGLAVLV